MLPLQSTVIILLSGPVLLLSLPQRRRATIAEPWNAGGNFKALIVYYAPPTSSGVAFAFLRHCETELLFNL